MTKQELNTWMCSVKDAFSSGYKHGHGFIEAEMNAAWIVSDTKARLDKAVGRASNMSTLAGLAPRFFALQHGFYNSGHYGGATMLQSFIGVFEVMDGPYQWRCCHDHRDEASAIECAKAGFRSRYPHIAEATRTGVIC